MSKDDTPTTDRAIDRRRFLTVLGVAGGGTAALSGCSTDRMGCTSRRVKPVPSNSMAIPAILSIEGPSAPADRPRSRVCTTRAA